MPLKPGHLPRHLRPQSTLKLKIGGVVAGLLFIGVGALMVTSPRVAPTLFLPYLVIFGSLMPAWGVFYFWRMFRTHQADGHLKHGVELLNRGQYEDAAHAFEMILEGVPLARVGVVRNDDRFIIAGDRQSAPLVNATLAQLKEAWQRTLQY